jgi:uroporphyrin-III C-methyltransferase
VTDAPTATVALVGAGPGDVDLLTLRASARLETAATVMCDDALVPLATALAAGAHVVPADGLTPDAVARLLAAGPAPAVRLYEGDPWLHDSHGAEAAALTGLGVATVAVPGVSCAIGRATLARRPTHHRHRSVVAVIHGPPLPDLHHG